MLFLWNVIYIVTISLLADIAGKRNSTMRIETLAVHAGHHADPATGAVALPIYLSTTFERSTDGSYPHGYV